jgi:HD-GYP domain-containing protein (c-di-GMP phosphodiesterase class II)
MLLCSVDRIEPGAVVAAPVVHPRRRDVELLSPGAVLDAHLLRRLRELEIQRVWIRNEATADLDELIDPQIGRGHRVVYQRLKRDFSELAQRTVTSGDLQSYRQVVLDLVCELISNQQYAGITEILGHGPTDFFDHCASVAYIAVLTGLELDTYLVQQRPTMNAQNASDVTNLGLGAMLHDIGKLATEPDVSEDCELAWMQSSAAVSSEPERRQRWQVYRQHPLAGYRMMRHAEAPATVSQIVLNHHQRFDGTGFPDLGEISSSRCRGTQSRAQIHVFTRIVSVANTLDRLMRDDHGRSRPPVAALAELGQQCFEGWFDPVIADTVRRKVPPFAVGTHVRLNDGRNAAVVGPNVEQPCRPVVRLIDEDQRLEMGSFPAIELGAHPELHIQDAAGQYVEPYLFEMPKQRPHALSTLAGSLTA